MCYAFLSYPRHSESWYELCKYKVMQRNVMHGTKQLNRCSPYYTEVSLLMTLFRQESEPDSIIDTGTTTKPGNLHCTHRYTAMTS